MSRIQIGVLAAASGIQIFLLFVPPIVGVADQADYARVMSAFNIEYPAEMAKTDHYFCYLQTKFIITPERKAGRGRIPYFSSELLFAGAAIVLNSVVFKSGGFDIRMLGLAHAFAFLLALGLVISASARLNRTTRAVLGILLLLVCCDAGYLTYFNSFFSEPASYIFGLAFIGSTLLLIQGASRDLWRLGACVGLACLFIAAKPQNIPLVLPIASFFVLCIRPLEPTLRLWSPVCAASAALLLCVAAESYGRVPAAMRRANLYESIFSELLPVSPDPESDLRALGLDPELARFAGTNYWSVGAYGGLELYQGGVSAFRLPAFYVAHPARLLRVLRHGASASLSNRYAALGNYERSSGRPCRTLTASFTRWDELRRRLNQTWFLALFLGANLVAPLWIARRRTGRFRLLLQFHTTLAFMATLSFLIATLLAGIETQKHLFLFNFLFDCCLVGDVVWLCYAASIRQSIRRPNGAALVAT